MIRRTLLQYPVNGCNNNTISHIGIWEMTGDLPSSRQLFSFINVFDSIDLAGIHGTVLSLLSFAYQNRQRQTLKLEGDDGGRACHLILVSGGQVIFSDGQVVLKTSWRPNLVMLFSSICRLRTMRACWCPSRG